MKLGRGELLHRIGELAMQRLVPGAYVTGDAGEPFAGADFCEPHAEIVARWETLESGTTHWVGATSMGTDGHRFCEFGGCDRHLDFGGLTDGYGIDSALGITETNPKECHVYASELELAARSMMQGDPRWELWEHHARIVIRRAR